MAKGSDNNIVKHFLTAFAIAVGGYALFFAIDSNVRTRKGPWEVEFFQTNSEPAIRVTQQGTGISNVVIVFKGETVTNELPKTREFRQPKRPVPFGVTKFEDLTYLPGSVAFDFFGHEVELLPRTLYINKQEFEWKSGMVYELKPTEKLPPEKFYDPRKKKRRFGG